MRNARLLTLNTYLLKFRIHVYLSITLPDPPVCPRLGANESSSSKNIIHGEDSRALENTFKKVKYIINM